MANETKKKPRKSKNDKLAVVLVDMQNVFVCSLNKTADRIIANQIKVINWCVEKDIPLIVLEFKGLRSTIKVLGDEISKIAQTKTFIKEKTDGFSNADLAVHLNTLGVNTLFLMGIYADACVRDTAKGARKAGFKIITSDEVIAHPWSDHLNKHEVAWYRERGTLLNSVNELY